MNRSRTEGYSVIEWLIVISILTISVSLAVPSWNDARNRKHVTSSSEQLAAFVASARSLSVRLNRDISVSLSHEGRSDWCVGMAAGDAPCDCRVKDASAVQYCAVEGVPKVLSSQDLPPTELAAHSEDTDMVYDRVRGALATQDATRPHHFDLLSGNGGFGLRVGISPVGMVFICHWMKSANNTAYRSCEPSGGVEPENQGLTF